MVDPSTVPVRVRVPVRAGEWNACACACTCACGTLFVLCRYRCGCGSVSLTAKTQLKTTKLLILHAAVVCARVSSALRRAATARSATSCASVLGLASARGPSNKGDTQLAVGIRTYASRGLKCRRAGPMHMARQPGLRKSSTLFLTMYVT